MMLFSICDSESNDVTAICANDVINIGSTTFACLVLIIGSIYVFVNSEQRWVTELLKCLILHGKAYGIRLNEKNDIRPHHWF